MLGNLLPYQLQGFYLLKDIEKKKRGAIFDPLLFGGKGVLIFLMMMVKNFHLSMRNENMNIPKKMREQPENTIVFSKSVNMWRTNLERYGSHLRVLYHEGSQGRKINFHTTDIVVSSCLNLKQLEDPCSKSIKQHEWYRLVVDEDMLSETENKDTIDFILKLNVKKRWVVGKPEMLVGSTSAKANFLYALLVGSPSAKNYPLAFIKNVLKHAIPSIEDLYHFGSKLVKTIPVELTDEEKEIYLVAEIRVKEKLKDIKLSDQQPEENRLKKDRFQNLELSILRLREMISSIPLALKKGDIQEILCRLSVKQLTQLRCVCKSWNSLIYEDSNFAKKHLRLSTSCLADVWIMKEFGNEKSWTKLLTVPYFKAWGLCRLDRVLYISEDDQVLMEIYMTKNKLGQTVPTYRVVVYDSINNTFQFPEFQNKIHDDDDDMVPEVYVESLISPF